jgi:hypothetical protein
MFWGIILREQGIGWAKIKGIRETHQGVVSRPFRSEVAGALLPSLTNKPRPDSLGTRNHIDFPIAVVRSSDLMY